MKLHDKVEKILQELYELAIPNEIESLQDENMELKEEIIRLEETIQDLEETIQDLQNQ